MPGAVREGYAVVLRAAATDRDHEPSELNATWSSGAGPLCGATPVSADGTTSCEAVLGLDDEVVSVEVTDPEGAAGLGTVHLTITPTLPPTASISSPGANGPFYSDRDVPVAATVGDLEDAPELLTVVWTDETGATLPIGGPPSAEGLLSGTSRFSAGAHALTLVVTDTTGKSTTTTAAFTVGGPNTPPACAVLLPVDGASGAPSQPVSLRGQVTDPDVAPSRLTAAWSSDRDGPLGSGAVDAEGLFQVEVPALSGGRHVLTLSGADEVGAICSASVTMQVEAPPTVGIASPADGSWFNEGDSVVFSATVSDDATAPQDLSLRWTSDLSGVLDTHPASPLGVAAFALAELPHGTHTITLTATDGSGLSAATSVITRINGLPTAPAVRISPAGAGTGDDLRAEITTPPVDPEGDPLSLSYRWTLRGAATAFTAATVPAAATTRGETWSVSVVAHDGHGDGPAGSAEITVGNTAPLLQDVSLGLAPGLGDGTLACTPGVATDADGDPISYRHAWSVNGAPVATTAATLPSGWGRGDVVVCTVTPDDGFDLGLPVSSAPFTIRNAAPSIDGVTITPAAPRAADTLTCAPTGFVDADGDPDRSRYAWTVNGAPAGAGMTLSGAFSAGDRVGCTVTPSDGIDEGAPMWAAVSVINTAPVLGGVTLSPAIAAEDSVLTCTPGPAADDDGDAVTFAFRWTVDGAPLTVTAGTLGGEHFARGEAVACVVTPHDGREDGAAVASNTVQIANSAPVVRSARLTPDAPVEGDTVVLSVDALDVDGDAVSYEVAWFVSGVPVGLSGEALGSGAFQHGDSVHAEVTPFDGTSYGTTVTTAPVWVQNTAPVASSVTLTPAEATEVDTLTCAATGEDADGDALTWSYAWVIDGATLAVAGDTLTGADFAKGDVVVCLATPHDGHDAGAARSSSAVPILNTAPTLTAVELSPSAATETSVLSCAAAGDDVDGDPITYTVRWSVNEVEVSVGGALDGRSFGRGDVVTCAATPHDGEAEGASGRSAPIKVRNTAPVATGVTLTPADASEADTLVCSATGTDVDGDPLRWSYTWTIGGAPIAATTPFLTGESFQVGDLVVCIATPDDGELRGIALASDPVRVHNEPPTLGTVSLTPTVATEASTLTCAPVATDPEGDALSYAWAWTVNGAAIAATTSTLDGAWFRRGDAVRCLVTPYDTSSAGLQLGSNTVTIQNTAPVMVGVSISPTTASETSVLTCAPSATDLDGDAVSFTLVWSVQGLEVGTGPSLDGAWFRQGDAVVCTATPFDGAASGPPLASAPVTIRNTAPAVTGVVLGPPTPTEVSVLTCNATSTDVDGDEVTLAWRWTVNGVTLAATTSTLSGASFNRGDMVQCAATPFDGALSGATVVSNDVFIRNTLPTMVSVSLSEPAWEASTLTCTPSATDVDGDTISYAWAWTVNGATIAATTSTLRGESFRRGDAVGCRVTPSDAAGAGAAMSSAAVVIRNTAPVTSQVTLTPAVASEASTLVCTPTSTDADGDTVTHRFAWTVNGATILASGSTLTGASFDAGDTVVCQATPDDGTEPGAPASSSPVTIRGSAPVLSAVSLAPDPAYETSTLACTPSTAVDADGDAVTLRYGWLVNGTPIAATTPTLTGASFSHNDRVGCVVTPDDGALTGAPVASNEVVIRNTLPVMVSVALSEPAWEASTLTCTPSATDVDGDTISYAWAWTVNGAPIAATTSTLTGASFRKGDAVACRVTPSDAAGAGSAMSSAAVVIRNTAPVTSQVTLTPAVASEASTLACTPTSTDADGDTVTHRFAWTVNGATLLASGSTLTGASFNAGDVVTCRATPDDGDEPGLPVSSGPVTIRNTAPTLSSVSLTPGVAYETSTLVCTPSAADVDGDVLSYAYAWLVNGAPVAGSGSALTGVSFRKGDAVTCRVTVSDPSGPGDSLTSAAVTIRNSAPVTTAVALSPNPAYEEDTLTCAPTSTDADGDAVSHSFTWAVNGNTIGATSATLPAASFVGGDTVTCAATANDGAVSGLPVSSNVVTIFGTLPVMSSVVLSPNPAYETTTLVCTPSAVDPQGDAITFAYAWLVNGAPIAAATPTLTGANFRRGDVVACRVTPSDLSGAGRPLTSAAITISNTAPVATGVTLGPTPAYEGSVLNCSASGSDVDGDTVSYTWSWTVNGLALAHNLPVLTGASFNKGDVVSCVATPTDGADAGVPISSAPVTIGNTAPAVTRIALSPLPAYVTTRLTCTPTATDVDNDPITYTYVWLVNGAQVGGDSPSIANLFTRGASVACRVTPRDGLVSGPAVTSDPVIIQNSLPVTTVAITPAPAFTDDTVTCTPTTTDADGDTWSHTFAWKVNNVAVMSTQSTLAGTFFNRGDVVSCTVTPRDTSANGAPATALLTISNTPPIPLTANLYPEVIGESSIVSCSGSVLEPDLDSVVFLYAWYINGLPIPPTTKTISGEWFNRGDVVSCAMSAFDGIDTGASLMSRQAIVTSLPPVISSVVITPSGGNETTTLTCTPTATDPDGDPFWFTYQWYVVSMLTSVTTQTITGANFNRGNRVYCVATPHDAFGAGEPEVSPQITITNAPPAVVSVSLTPASPVEGSTLTCAATSSDPDGDSVTHSFAWFVNGSPITPTTPTIHGAWFRRGDRVFCRVTPTDGTTPGNPVESTTLIILNTPPPRPTVSITPSAPRQGVDAIVCRVTAGGADADGDVVDYAVTWRVDGQPYPGTFAAAGPVTTVWADDTVPAADSDLGSTWTCTVTPFDGTQAGASAQASVTAAPPGPPAPRARLGPPPARSCTSGAVEVGYLPGWATTRDEVASLGWAELMAGDLVHGGCALNIHRVAPGFGLMDLVPYQVLILGNPAGRPYEYTLVEQIAIRQYLEGGHGGAYASLLFRDRTPTGVLVDNGPLLDLFGVDERTVSPTASPVVAAGAVVDPAHPVVAGLPASFRLSACLQEQGNLGGWSEADLFTSADLVITGAGQSSVIVNDDTAWRTVWATGFPEHTPGAASQRLLYNALIWAAGEGRDASPGHTPTGSGLE